MFQVLRKCFPNTEGLNLHNKPAGRGCYLHFTGEPEAQGGHTAREGKSRNSNPEKSSFSPTSVLFTLTP